jgi:hypothetical protein
MGDANSKSAEANPAALISRKTGDWWQDDRRNWCAYCGLKMRFRKGPSNAKTCATKDHLIPKADSGVLTIPCCLQCNLAKGRLSIDRFLETAYFANARAVKRPTQWQMVDLQEALKLAAIEPTRTGKGSDETEIERVPVLRLKAAPVYLSQRFRADLFDV